MFVNDEQAKGKWALLGVAETKEGAKEENFVDDDYNIKELYLLPNGEPYWVISWTKDTIYIGGRPNHYEIVGDKLYERVLGTSIEFVEDERVLGTWESVDFIKNKESFNPEKLQSSKDMLSLEKLIFDGNGKVKVSYNSGKVFDTKYTKNYVINLILPDTLCKYTYQEILGKKYIIVEWKSGDYVFGKIINGYYVLEKQD